MKKIILLSALVIFVSCSSTKTEQVPVEPPTEKTETKPVKTQSSENKTSEPSTAKKTLNTVAKPFKKLGAGVEQAFDRLSKKDKDGDGE